MTSSEKVSFLRLSIQKHAEICKLYVFVKMCFYTDKNVFIRLYKLPGQDIMLLLLLGET